MLIGLGIFLMILGSFFIALGLLFLNYKLSPLKFFIKESEVYVNVKLAVQIMVPGIVLFWLAFKVMVTS